MPVLLGQFRALMLASIALSTVACTQSGTIFKELNINDGTGVSLDARQRTILVKTDARGKGQDIVCSEPSPDAVAALAASVGVQASAQAAQRTTGRPTGGQASFSRSFAESVASIGLRSQTIQLLRDQLFRACEAYMNGAIGKSQYNQIVTNMDRVIISTLAVDALGASPVAPAVAIGTTASGGTKTPPQPAKSENGSAQVAAQTKTQATSITPSFHGATIKAPPEQPHRSEAIAKVALKVLERNPTTGVCIGILSDRKLRHEASSAAFEFCKMALHTGIHIAEHEVGLKKKSHGH